ncbi:hypothetical protein [Chitinophaga cymbidii]|uniref:hypothetical protein n=1 Tax=Chitinophaga cymbidii TaxID=1096750 RepID=UPI0011BF97FF|nr:hypothetical protein [Chitinophaga cymbidii]
MIHRGSCGLSGEEIYRAVPVSCREISFQFANVGFDVIHRYSRQSFQPYSDTPKTYCFDDLGLESPVQCWGNTCNVMAEILLSRYDLYVSQHRMVTHVTTNLNSGELEEAYGPRVRSRMREMFNLVAFEEGSRDKRG